MSLSLVRELYLDQPKEVSLETFSRCNAACTFCPYPTLERIGTKMPDALMWRLVDEMSEWTIPFDFCPFKVNEPLLDKRLMPLLERVESQTIADIRLFTNGQALTEKWVEQINQLDRLKVLWISLNDHRPDEYKKLMGLDFERTARNLDFLHDSDFIHPVTISRVGHSEEFQRYVHSRWPNFEIVQIKKDGWLGYTEPGVDVVPNTPCSRWFELSIAANGIVGLCCMDGQLEHSIGDLNKQTMLEVYNSPHWRDRRERMISRKEVFPCSTCTY
jgi:hypothetical protein